MLILFMLMSLGLVQAQENPQPAIGRNGVYLELYALRHDFNSGPVSLNYERFLGKRGGWVVRGGLYPDFESLLCIPITVSGITGPLKKHHFEYGIGGVYRMEWFQGNFYQDMPAVWIPLMYRFQRHKGFYLRAGINLWISWPILPSPSLSAGWRF